MSKLARGYRPQFVLIDDTPTPTRSGERPTKIFTMFRLNKNGDGHDKVGYVQKVIHQPARWRVYRLTTYGFFNLGSFDGVGCKERAIEFLKNMSL